MCVCVHVFYMKSLDIYKFMIKNFSTTIIGTNAHTIDSESQ